MYLVILLLLSTFLTYKFYKDRYNFWAKLNVPFIKPTPPFGNIVNTDPKSTQLVNFYKYFKERGCKYGGIYALHKPIFVPVDLNVIKHILLRDYGHFDHKAMSPNKRDQPISTILFFLRGSTWKNMRQKVSPMFSTFKLKLMIPNIVECRQYMLEDIEYCYQNKLALNIRKVTSIFAANVIASLAFGIDCNGLNNLISAEISKHGDKIFEESFIQTLKWMVMIIFPKLATALKMAPFSKDVDTFFTSIIDNAFTYRKENNIIKNDFMQLFINLFDEGKITYDEFVSQIFNIFLGGYETTSTTLTNCLFELAHYPEIQDKVREEIREVYLKYDEEITYKSLTELTYTKQVIDETLRKHSISEINRTCSKTYQIPGESAIIPGGTNIFISVHGIHYDPDYYPNPNEFDPDRFSKDNIHKIKAFTYLPFGGGSRICVGIRLAILQVKIGLITLLKDYSFKLNSQTSPPLNNKFKLIFEPNSHIFLDVEKVK